MKYNRKQNWNKHNNSWRSLCLETLENREMLSATPMNVAPFVNENVAIIATADLSNAVVDPVDVGASTGDLTFVTTDVANKYVMSWNPIEGAASYNVKISRDGGETWITYYKTTSADNPAATSCTVKGVYIGGDYSYRVYGVNENDKLFDVPLQGTFAPIKIASTVNSYQAGDTIDIALSGADDASAAIKWYYATGNGDVEITDARGRLSYVPTAADYPIRVVATGTGYSEGSVSDVTIIASSCSSTISYNADERILALDWSDVGEAAMYRVLLSRDGGESWFTYAKTTESDISISGIYVGKSYSYKILAYNNAEKLNASTLIISDAGTFTPVSLDVDAVEFKAGDTINASLKGADDASANIAWFYVIGEEDVEIPEAAGLYSYTPESAENDVKIVLTGTNNSEGSGAEVVVKAHVNLVGNGEFSDYVTLSRSVELKWNVVENAAAYRFLKSSTTSSTGWKKAATITVEDGAVTSGNAFLSDDGATLTYTIGMFNVGDNGDFRVVAVDEHGYTLETQEFSFTNFGLELDHDAYLVTGDTLTASTIPTTSATFQWYSSSDAGENWTEIPGATSKSYTISADEGAAQLTYKVVATSETGETSVAFAAPNVLSEPYNLDVSVDENNILNMTFGASDDADVYQIEYYYDGATYPVWLNMTQVAYVDNGDGTITATHVNGENYAGYIIRVRAVGPNETLSAWNGVRPVMPMNLAVDSYDAQTTSVTLVWDAQTEANSFIFSGTVTDLDGNTTPLDVVTLDGDSYSYVYANVDDGYTYKFAVRSSTSAGESQSATVSFATALVRVDYETASVGDVVTASLSSPDATASYQWLGSTDDGLTWNVLEGETNVTLVLPDGYSMFKVVATGTGASEGSSSEAFVTVDSTTGQERPSLVVTTTADTLDVNDHQISFREALLYRQYLLERGTITQSTPITFSSTVFDGSEETVITLAADTDVTYSCDYYSDAATGGGFTIDSSLNIDASELDEGSVVFDAYNLSSRAFTVNGSNTVFSLNNIAIWNAAEGSIISSGATVNIVDSAFEFNIESAIVSSGGTLNISGDSVFAYNSIEGSGAAINATNTNLVIDGASFLNNEASVDNSQGGAIRLYSTSPSNPFTATINNASFTENTAEASQYSSRTRSSGGAIYVQNYQSLTISNSTISNNQSTGAYQGAGAIMCVGTSLIISDSIISGNHTKANGGAIYLSNTTNDLVTKFTVTNTTFDGNYSTNSSKYIGSTITYNSVANGKTNCGIEATFINSSFVNTTNNPITTPAFYIDQYSQNKNNCSFVVFENTLFANIPGAVYSDSFSSSTAIPLTFINSTFVNNNGTALKTGASMTSIYNSIFWNNTTNLNGNNITVGASLAQTSSASVSGDLWIATSNSPSPLNPEYTINPNAATVTLTNGQRISLIDSGVNSKVHQSVDLAGNTRIVGAAVDLGAYEVQASSSALIDEAFADYFDEFFE